MKDGWESSRLRDLTTKIGSGATPTGGESAYAKEGIALIRSLNIHDSEFRFKDLARISDEQARKLDYVSVASGDVLLNITGASIARCSVVPDEVLPARVNQHVSILRPVGTKLLPAFLNYLIVSPQYKDRLLSTGEAGSTRQALTKAQLEDFEITIPNSISEQQRIVSILDEAFEGIATAKESAEKNLQNARAIFESYVESTFTERADGWQRRCLGEIASFRNGVNFTRSSKGASVKIVGVKDFQDNFYSPLVDIDSVTIDGEIPDSDLLRENDILFVRSNGNRELIGRTMLVGSPQEKTTFSGFTIRARLQTTDILPAFLCRYLKSGIVRQELIDGGNGANISSLNQTVLSELTVPLPPKRQQSRLLVEIEEVDNETQSLESIYQQKLKALDDLKKSLLDQTFSGNL